MATNGIRQETVNTFKDGMIMDYNPLIVPNTAYTHALNATYITMNGNEHIILNDMGNGRVETAYLPEGYIPLGTTEFGGIIYIVSYNPLTDRCQIGSFPSPERNVTSDELGESEKTLNTSVFYDSVDSTDLYKSIITACTYKLTLTDSALNPGDKFVVYETTGSLSGCGYISAKTQDLDLSDVDLYPKYLKLSIVAILDNGTVTSLNDALTWYEYDSNNYGYYIYPDASDVESDGTLVLDEYRNLVSSNYSVFTCKVSGKLAILAELEVIDTFSVSWDAIKQSVSDDSGDSENKWVFYFYTNWSYENDNFNSKDKINLYGIKVEEFSANEDGNVSETTTGDAEYIIIDNYPKKANGVTYIDGDLNSSSSDDTNDALTNLRTKFYTPDYISSLDVLTDDNGNAVEDIYEDNSNNTTRTNDGNDNQFLILTGYVLQQEAENGKYGYVLLVVSPMMPFGTLDYLKQSFTINVDKLGSGDIDLKGYKYWWEEENITLNWSLECYPERNKSVKSVTFNFYEYNEDVKAWIEDENNTQYIDDYALWYDGESYSLLENANDEAEEITGDSCKMEPYSGDPDATFVKDNLSSYSGNFSYPISQSTLGLNNGSLYLVEIIVNYNDEKYVYYYRFMYTSNIFNGDCYNNVDDYKDLVLNDYLTNDNVISVTATNIELSLNSTAKYVDLTINDGKLLSGDSLYNTVITESDDAITVTYASDESSNSNDNEIEYTTNDEILFYKDEKTLDVEYIYQNQYLGNNVTFDIEATNSIFDVTIKALGKKVNQDSVSTVLSSDDFEVSIDLSDVTSNTIYKSSSIITDNEASVDYHFEIEDLEIKNTNDYQGNEINFDFLLNNYIYIDYNYLENLNVEYSMEPLTVGYYYLAMQNGQHWCNCTFILGSIYNATKDGLYGIDWTSDDDFEQNYVEQFDDQTNSMSATFDRIDDALDLYDVVVMQFFSYSASNHGVIFWTYYDYSSFDGDGWAQYTASAGDIPDEAFILYAIRNESGDPSIFIFQDNHAIYRTGTNDKWVSSNGWYGKGDYVKPNEYLSDGIYCPIGFEICDTDWDVNTSEDNLPFINYYKLVDYTGSYSAYTYGTITLPNTYTWNINFSCDYQASIVLSINNTEIIASDSNFGTMPNNLSYYWLYNSKEHDTAFTMTVADSISFSDVSNELQSTDKDYLILPDGTITETEITSKKGLYNKNGDLVTYLKRLTGNADKDVEIMTEYPQDIELSYNLQLNYTTNDGLYYKTVSEYPLSAGALRTRRMSHNNFWFPNNMYVPILMQDS